MLSFNVSAKYIPSFFTFRTVTNAIRTLIHKINKRERERGEGERESSTCKCD